MDLDGVDSVSHFLAAEGDHRGGWAFALPCFGPTFFRSTRGPYDCAATHRASNRIVGVRVFDRDRPPTMRARLP
jgi:hypothetical protein